MWELAQWSSLWELAQLTINFGNAKYHQIIFCFIALCNNNKGKV